jgi:sec-independent protein translocase protein TatC
MKEMSLTEHLTELRKRIIRIVLILILAFFGCYGIADQLADVLLLPLREALGSEGKIVFLGLLDKVLVQFQLAFWSSVIFSSPIWFHQLWLFLKPGLHEHEVKAIRPFILLGFSLFVSGIAFGYFVVFPFTFETILGFGVQNIEATMSLRDYLVLASKVLVFLGFLFQLPNVLLILGFMGIVNKQMLSDARRYVAAGFAVLSAVMTPPDIITMMALWIPLMALYEIGLWLVALIVDPFKKKKQDEWEKSVTP